MNTKTRMLCEMLLTGVAFLAACAPEPAQFPASDPAEAETGELAPSTPNPLPEPQSTPTKSPTTTPTVPRRITLRSLNQPVQRAWFYGPPVDGDLVSLLQYFDSFVLSDRDDQVRDYLRSQGIIAPMLMYLSFDSVQDPGSCTAKPRRNQVAFHTGDFCTLIRQHPDWFLRDAKGNLIHEEVYDPDVLMDPAKPGWRAFWVQRAAELMKGSGWDGIFIDNVEASLGKRQRLKILPAAYPNDTAYQSAVEGLLSYMYSNYFHPNGFVLEANIIDVKDNQVWFRLLQHLDGAMEEAFAVDWHMGYFKAPQWEANLHDVERAQALGKRLILVAQGTQDDTPRQEFAYASYLLIADGHSSFRYASAAAYDQVWVYPNYEIDLGAPLGPRYREGNVWKRDYANGSVTVDPEAHTGAINPR